MATHALRQLQHRDVVVAVKKRVQCGIRIDLAFVLRMPTPFAGLTTKPPCDACEHATDPHPHAPSAPPPRIVPLRGRRRQVDTSTHFCPNPDCAYRGWVGWGNLRANGHPNGGPWRQLLGVACRRYFLETLGT